MLLAIGAVVGFAAFGIIGVYLSRYILIAAGCSWLGSLVSLAAGARHPRTQPDYQRKTSVLLAVVVLVILYVLLRPRLVG